ncbi:MAG: 2-oxoacid:acceptor oxidoreductase family protein [Dehalococcoidales bacterium]|jgi:pyruvate ferredoxin oxidoreductase gamma subunit|nr:2-oxoacid:acceptor oxidoreductase family protein [Dehalococcoidales bacterium]|tara:strand:- start:2137 stop:2703 length:567 start_codon:yes stop_codon:yes gene_type:complete
MINKDLVEVKWYGRGGQGVVTSAELVAQAAINEDKYAQAFPSFSPERRGAPVLAFNRISITKPIRTRAEIDQPNVVMVLDLTLMSIMDIASGLKEDGIIIVNTKKSDREIKAKFDIKSKVVTVDATRIAQEYLGVPIVNTAMIGALIKITDAIKIVSMREPLEKRFGKLAERNVKAMEKAYQETLTGE